MITVTGPQVPDCQGAASPSCGCCLLRLRVTPAEQQRRTLHPQTCVGSFLQSGSMRSACSPSENGLQEMALPIPESFSVGRHSHRCMFVRGGKTLSNPESHHSLLLESRQGSVSGFRFGFGVGVYQVGPALSESPPPHAHRGLNWLTSSHYLVESG